MKSQTTNENTDSIRFLRKMNSNALRPLAIAVLMLLVTVSYANAQTLPGLTPGSCPIGPTICSNPACGGGNLCPSPQYRYGAAGSATTGYNPNADLTGNPIGDKNVLNSTTVSQLVLLIPNGTPASGLSGCQIPQSAYFGTLSPLSPSSSLSIESRIIFPALYYDGIAPPYCALFTYDLLYPAAPQLFTAIGSETTYPYVSSSPGYNGDVVIAAEDGNVYDYGFDGPLNWTFPNPNLGIPFDSSPTVWPGLNYVYVVDVLGDIFYLDPGSGMPTYSITTQLVYPGGNNYWNSPGPCGSTPTCYTPSASSLSVSTASNTLFVAGSNGGEGDAVCAYPSLPNAPNPPPYWCQYFPTSPNTGITSSPVVSDSLGRVYVQDAGPSQSGIDNYQSTLYALDEHTGGIIWQVPLVPPAPIGPYSILVNPYGGSPAYDDAPQNGGSAKYVITYAGYNVYEDNPHGYTVLYSTARILAVYDATNGALVCSADIGHPVTQSSPEVVNGVIYIGTDDGYVLAYQEPPTCGGSNGTTLNLKWTSSTGTSCIQGSPCPMDSGLEGPPVVSFNRIHAVSKNGTLYVWHRPGW